VPGSVPTSYDADDQKLSCFPSARQIQVKHGTRHWKAAQKKRPRDTSTSSILTPWGNSLRAGIRRLAKVQASYLGFWQRGSRLLRSESQEWLTWLGRSSSPCMKPLFSSFRTSDAIRPAGAMPTCPGESSVCLICSGQISACVAVVPSIGCAGDSAHPSPSGSLRQPACSLGLALAEDYLQSFAAVVELHAAC
jgi:hypothetical protein